MSRNQDIIEIAGELYQNCSVTQPRISQLYARGSPDKDLTFMGTNLGTISKSAKL